MSKSSEPILKDINHILTKYDQKNKILRCTETEKDKEKGDLKSNWEDIKMLSEELKNKENLYQKLVLEKQIVFRICLQFNGTNLKENNKIEISLQEFENRKYELSEIKNDVWERFISITDQNKKLQYELEEAVLLRLLEERQKKLSAFDLNLREEERYDLSAQMKSCYNPPLNISKLLIVNKKKIKHDMKLFEKKIMESVKLDELFQKDIDESLLKSKRFIS